MYLICGMHRSGTSLVAKLFYNASADMGDPSTFHPADRWNPTGYYEQKDIILLNSLLLHGAWGKLAYLFLPNASTVLKRSHRHGELISRLGCQYANKIVKENRFCLTLPGWRANNGDVRRVLICLREPADVALSLRQRNKIPIWYSYRLWLTHLSALLENCSGLPTWFVRYESLLDPATNCSEITSALHFFGIDRSEQDVRALVAANVMPKLNDAAVNREFKYPEPIRTLWDDLLERHARQFQS